MATERNVYPGYGLANGISGAVAIVTSGTGYNNHTVVTRLELRRDDEDRADPEIIAFVARGEAYRKNGGRTLSVDEVRRNLSLPRDQG